MILGFRLGRRLIGVVALDGEQIVFHDSRYVSARKATFDANMTRYLRQLLEQLRPTTVCYYAPTNVQTATERLTTLLEQAASLLSIDTKRLTKPELFSSVGVSEPRTRREFKERMQVLCPSLDEGHDARQLTLAEAAGTAFVGDLHDSSPRSAR